MQTPVGNSHSTSRHRGNMNSRQSLFGVRKPHGLNGAGNYTNNNDFSDESQRLYEDQNNKEIDSLGSKISSLKHIALDIGKEVDSHNKMLESMESQMGNVGKLMGNAVDKITEMISSGGSKHMCYLVALIVLLFVFLYFLLMWR